MYFDSMGGVNHACHSALRVWLVAEAKDKKGLVLDLAGWKTATPKVSLVHSVATITLDMYVYTYVVYIQLHTNYTYLHTGIYKIACET